MAAISCALALLSGAVGAGFASGREILCFFAVHGRAAGASAAAALLTLCALFLRLPVQMERAECTSLQTLCIIRLGRGFGRVCAALFFVLNLLTGAAMLAACAELFALAVPIRHAYGVGVLLSLLLCAALCAHGAAALALPGAALCVLLPVFLFRLLALPAGEACFYPLAAPDLPVRAWLSGLVYGALNAAQLAGALPMLLPLQRPARHRAVLLFAALFSAALACGILICIRQLNAVWQQPLPFVWLSRALGRSGYFSAALCLYASAFSTFAAMVLSMAGQFPHSRRNSACLCALLCLPPALIGFSPLVKHVYPVLGALCAGLLLLLCLPVSFLQRNSD